LNFTGLAPLPPDADSEGTPKRPRDPNQFAKLIVDASVYTADQCVFKEDRQSRGCGCAALDPLQLCTDSQNPADHSGYGCWPERDHVWNYEEIVLLEN